MQQAACVTAIHERCLQLSALWPANLAVLQALWELWRGRKFALVVDGAGGRAALPAWLHTYAGGPLPALAEAPGPTEPAFALFLRIVVAHLCDAFPGLKDGTATGLEAARQDKTLTKLVSGYDGWTRVSSGCATGARCQGTHRWRLR